MTKTERILSWPHDLLVTRIEGDVRLEVEGPDSTFRDMGRIKDFRLEIPGQPHTEPRMMFDWRIQDSERVIEGTIRVFFQDQDLAPFVKRRLLED